MLAAENDIGLIALRINFLREDFTVDIDYGVDAITFQPAMVVIRRVDSPNVKPKKGEDLLDQTSDLLFHTDTICNEQER